MKFIKNTAEQQALLLPGRVSGFQRIDVKPLPSNFTKHGLQGRYADICKSTGQVSVGYSNFVTSGINSALLFSLYGRLLIYVGRARNTTIGFIKLYIDQKRRKWKQ